jgi:hypothetical protein
MVGRAGGEDGRASHHDLAKRVEHCAGHYCPFGEFLVFYLKFQKIKKFSIFFLIFNFLAI